MYGHGHNFNYSPFTDSTLQLSKCVSLCVFKVITVHIYSYNHDENIMTRANVRMNLESKGLCIKALTLTHSLTRTHGEISYENSYNGCMHKNLSQKAFHVCALWRSLFLLLFGLVREGMWTSMPHSKTQLNPEKCRKITKQ